MPSWRKIREAGLRELPATLYESPWHLMAIVALSIVLAEVLTMALLYFFLPLPKALWRIDPRLTIFILVPAILILFLFPSLVHFVLRPLRQNIRERRQAEEELQLQEKSFRSLAENSPDIIMRFDHRCRYLYANPAVERNLGLTAPSIIGKTDRELGMPEEMARIWENRLRLAFATGQPTSLEVVYPKPGGSIFEARLVPEPLGDGINPSVLVISRDVTERKKAEAELRVSREQLRNLSSHLQAAREAERTRIAREIHDELGQVLATLALDIALLEKELPLRQFKQRQKAATMGRLIGSTITTVQRVSAELRPNMLDDLGLAAAMQWQVRQFEKRTGIDCRLRIDLGSEEPDRDRSTALFRILQETLTNVMRHAQATRVSVQLTETDERYLLQVSDNGRGITREEIGDGHSLGLLGIRERAGFWGGKVEMRGMRQRGTTVRVGIPRLSASPSMPMQEPALLPEPGWLSGETGSHRQRAAS
ncbi:MAG: PAS domain S-box protein [Desulfuromonadales bacterium]|nr:PAS domain S-box protein [Desulfuromonadales bacterium]